MNAIYGRQSLDKKDSISIESQIDLCKREIINSDDIKIYVDKGFSGKNTDRPQFQKMMSDIKSGLIKRVYVYRLDRMSRALVDFAKIMEVFEKYGVEFVSYTEKFDTSTPIGKAMLSIIMVFAQLERETIQQRIKDNYYSRGEKGMYLGGPAPYGFNKEKYIHNGVKTSALVHDENIMPVATSIFIKYSLPDSSLGSVVKHLNDNNIPAPNGGKWESTKIQRILRNPIYVKSDEKIYLYYQNRKCNITNPIDEFQGNGLYLYGKRDRNVGKYNNIENHFLSVAPSLGSIDSDTFLKCQYKLDSNKQIKNSGKGSYTFLSGLTKCGKCGYALTVTTYKDYKYLTCRGRSSYNACEGNKTIHLNDVENQVIDAMIKKLDSYMLAEGKQNPSSTNSINAAETLRISQIETEITNLVNKLAASNDILTEYINNKVAQLHKEKEELVKKILKTSTKEKIDINVIYDDLKKFNTLDLNRKKSVTRMLISKVSITDTDIKIDWNI